MTEEKNRLSAVILCGGSSRRMGTDKAGLVIGGRTLLQRLAAQLAPLGEPRLSVQSAGDHGEVPLPKIPDRYPGCGPMGGLEAALFSCPDDVLFVTPVDLPFVDALLARELAARMDPETDALLVTDGGGRKQYLLGLYRKRVQPLLERRLRDGSRDALRIRSFLEEIRVSYVEAGELTDGKAKTRSCNTMEEYLALKAAEEPDGEQADRKQTGE